MIYELALISVAMGAGYWGWFFLRHRPHGTATFGAMQLAAAALAALGFAGRRFDIPGLGLPGAIGVGAGLCLLVVGPLARGLARRLVAAERMTLATRLLDIAEVLAPGSGVAEEKALVRAMTDIREGRIDQTVDALTSARERASAEARLAIDERIAMLYLAAYRWRDAIAYAEAHLFSAPLPDDAEGSLRRALGIAPPVWVDLLAAYGRVGDLDQAARMLARLEEVCSGRDDAALWLHRARMMFLALAGRRDAVRALVAPRHARHMSPAARLYWLAVAHEHHGDLGAAAAAYAKARARSRGRAKDLIDQALAGLATAAPAQLPELARQVAARVEAAPLPAPIRIARTRRARATWLMTASVLAVSAASALGLGSTSDIGVVIRAGAQVHSMTAAGEWWRVVSCVFVHFGVLHLVLNAVGLLVIGRIAEDMFGSARTIAVFGGAGVAGALASYLASPAGISAGASGGVFGLLGAVFVEITWHRARYRTAWKRGMWGGLAVVTVGQLAYDFLYPAVDQWAHGGGLLAGVLLGIVLSPSSRRERVVRMVGRALALGFGALTVVAAIFVVRTPLAESLLRAGLVRREIGGVAVQAPADWTVLDNHLVQRDGLSEVAVMRERVTAADTQRAAWLDAVRTNDEKHGRVTVAREPAIALPAGWQGSELVIESESESEDGVMDDRLRYRRIACSRAFGDQMIFAAILVPETIATAAPEVFARLLASIGPAG